MPSAVGSPTADLNAKVCVQVVQERRDQSGWREQVGWGRSGQAVSPTVPWGIWSESLRAALSKARGMGFQILTSICHCPQPVLSE